MLKVGLYVFLDLYINVVLLLRMSSRYQDEYLVTVYKHFWRNVVY